jgi:hypothetical protein
METAASREEPSRLRRSVEVTMPLKHGEERLFWPNLPIFWRFWLKIPILQPHRFIK